MTDATALQDMLYLLGRAEVPALYAGYQAAIGFDATVGGSRFSRTCETSNGRTRSGCPNSSAPTL